MIALMKIFKKIITKEGVTQEIAGAQPYAIYKDGILENLSQTDVIYNFPNNGKVFVTDYYNPPQKEFFKLFELNESNSYDESKPNSMKYSLGKEIYNVGLFEVIDLDESITLEKSKIVEKLTKGVYIPFYISNQILFRTSDDFLIGPLQMKFVEGVYIIEDLNTDFIQYYQQEIDIVPILDEYKNQERLFCTNNLFNENIEGWIDVADEMRVISDALKQLKDNVELGELSRKMISTLKEWYISQRVKEPHLQERLNRAIDIMQSNTLEHETVESFTKLLFDLQITEQIVNERTSLKFNQEYEKFLKLNKQLIKECTERKLELNNLEEKYLKTTRNLEMAEVRYSEFEKIMNDKIYSLKNNFAMNYADQLILSKFPNILPSSENPIPDDSSQSFIKYQSIVGTKINDFLDFTNKLKNNLANFKGVGNPEVLASIVVTAILLEEPIIIYGNTSYELAQCISKTIACEQTISIIPEIDKFSLNDLNKFHNYYGESELINSLIIHNPHLTSALYSLPAYLNQNKWTSETSISNLILITIDSFEEANLFIEKMLDKPIINSADYMSHFINKRNIRTIQPSQMKLETLEVDSLDEYSTAVRRYFREWIEDNRDMDIKIPYGLVEWINQLGEFIEEDLYETIYNLFNHLLVSKDYKQNDVGE